MQDSHDVLGQYSNSYRLVILGSSSLLMSAPSPDLNMLLPSNDVEWNEGKIGSNNALLTTDFHPSAPLGAFARVCQTLHILGKVLEHVQERNSLLDTTGMVKEAAKLHQILKSLETSLTEPNAPIAEDIDSIDCNYTALAICISARLLLYNQYACNEPGSSTNALRTSLEVELQQISLEGIMSLSSKIVPAMARRLSTESKLTLNQPCYPPVLAHCLYHAATECAWFIKEDGDPQMVTALEDIVTTLRMMQHQWHVCGKKFRLLSWLVYLQID